MRVLSLILLACGALGAQSLYVDGADPYAAKRRFLVGDLIQLSVDENMIADRQSNQAVTRQTGINGGVTGSIISGSGMSANVSLGTSGNNTGSTHKSDQLSTVVTVRVEKIREDGALDVKGDRLVDLDGEEEHLTVVGVLRPEDVALDSSASSQRLYGEQLHLEAKGIAAKGGKLGWLHWMLGWAGL